MLPHLLAHECYVMCTHDRYYTLLSRVESGEQNGLIISHSHRWFLSGSIPSFAHLAFSLKYSCSTRCIGSPSKARCACSAPIKPKSVIQPILSHKYTPIHPSLCPIMFQGHRGSQKGRSVARPKKDPVRGFTGLIAHKAGL